MSNDDKAAALLSQVRAVIERGWTRGSYAVDEFGRTVDVGDEDACAWCVSGAFEFVQTTHAVDWSDAVHDAYSRLRSAIVAKSSDTTVWDSRLDEVQMVVNWNDTIADDQEDVLDVLDAAING